MIDAAVRQRPVRPDRWRFWWLVLLVLVLAASSGFLVGGGRPARSPVALPSAYPSVPVLEAIAVPPAASPPAATPIRTNLVASRVPTHGSGKFVYAQSRGPVLGIKGRLRHFRVAVERDSGEDVAAFADEVQATLGDPRSWIGGGGVRLQLVAGGDPADFTVFLATRDTAGEMCARGGTNIRVGGVPYTSCRVNGKAIINLDRWHLSAKPYRNADVPLAVYRQYVINHEVGHELGHHHQGCPRPGGPAPVMVQQTLTTRGCEPYAWPRRAGRLLTGPPI